jgi:hypothetical protein
MPINNKRIAYFCQGLFWKAAANTENPALSTFAQLRGVQSIGVTPTQDITDIRDLGKSQSLGRLYGKPNIEITIERVLPFDGSDPRFYNIGTSPAYATHYFPKHFGMDTWSANVLSEYDLRLVYSADDALPIVDEMPSGKTTDSLTQADFDAQGPGIHTGSDRDGNMLAYYDFKYCLLTNISYSISLEGPITESLTFIAKVQKRYNGGDTNTPKPSPRTNLLRRQHYNSEVGGETELGQLPKELDEIVEDYNDKLLQSIDINVAVNYEQLTDMGYWRGSPDSKFNDLNKFTHVTLPVEITTSFTIAARREMQRHILMRDTNFMGSPGDTVSNGTQHIPDRDICIPLIVQGIQKSAGPMAGSPIPQAGTLPKKYIFWDLGAKNYLTDISITGGDTGGGNVEMTFEYKNDYNDYFPYGPTETRTTLTPPARY